MKFRLGDTAEIRKTGAHAMNRDATNFYNCTQKLLVKETSLFVTNGKRQKTSALKMPKVIVRRN